MYENTCCQQRKIQILWLFCAVSLAATIPCASRGDDDSSKAPPQRFQLKIADQVIDIQEGHPVTIPGSLENATVELTVLPTRLFRGSGLQFEYPRQYTYEHERDAETSTWTISGTDYTVMVMEYAFRVTPRDLLDGIADELDSMPRNRKSARLELMRKGKQESSHRFRGRQMEISIGSEFLHYEAFELPPWRGHHRLLVLMDVLDEKHEFSEDARRTRKMISESFKLIEQDL